MCRSMLIIYGKYLQSLVQTLKPEEQPLPAVHVPVISGERLLGVQPKDATSRADKNKSILSMITATELPEGEHLTPGPCAPLSEKSP